MLTTGRNSDSAAATGAIPTPERPFVPGLPGRLLAGAYGAVVERRNARFDQGRGVITFDRPVISVGNITLGGTGKTPVVAMTVALLRAHGRDPCIAMRGYGAKRNPGGASDEAELHRAAFDDLPIVAQPNRVEGLIKLFNTERGGRVDCIVLDDGFQHRRIARQLDLLLLDATHDVFTSGVFPAGRLREPLANARRATHVLITHAEMLDADALIAFERRARELVPDAAHAAAAHEWSRLALVERGSRREEPVAWLRGKRAVAACAIARPTPFLAALRRAGAALIDSFALPDHDAFSERTLAAITAAAERARAEAVVLTEKDWTKLAGREHVRWPCPVAIPRLEMRFLSGWERLKQDLLAAAASSPE